MITDEIRPQLVMEKLKDAPVINGTNVDTLPKPGKQVGLVVLLVLTCCVWYVCRIRSKRGYKHEMLSNEQNVSVRALEWPMNDCRRIRA